MWIVRKVVGFWHILDPGIKGFVAGIVAGVLLSAASLHFAQASAEKARQERIARQNAEAALDVTRQYATDVAGEVTVYARLLAQKEVELVGALGEVARLRGDLAKLSAKFNLVLAGIDTSASHSVDPGDGGSPVAGDPGVAVKDSLVLAGPPVEGTVSVAVSAQPDTTVRFDWSAKLQPTPVVLSVGLGCGEQGPEFLVQGPAWSTTEISTGEVDPEVCNPVPARVSVVERGLQVVGGAAVVWGVAKAIIELVK